MFIQQCLFNHIRFLLVFQFNKAFKINMQQINRLILNIAEAVSLSSSIYELLFLGHIVLN